MEHFEPETEIHRSQKAVKSLLNQPRRGADILFRDSSVLILAPPEVLMSPGGQLTVALITNLLSRMKALVSRVSLPVPEAIALNPIVPLIGNDLRSGLEQLAASVSGPQSHYPVSFDFRSRIRSSDVTLCLGQPQDDSAGIWIGANAWTAYVNTSHDKSDWNTSVPFGPHLAATLGVAEIFKRLLAHNFTEAVSDLQFKLLENVEFSALTYGADPGNEAYPDLGQEILLDNVAIAGVGAGGSAAVYSLACLPQLAGTLALIDPGNHKKSNLSRYLLSTYDDCYNATYKVSRTQTFLAQRHPKLVLQVETEEYAGVFNRDFRAVVSTVDTPEARWTIQRDYPPVILDAAVVETIYTLLRVYPGRGRCLGCKHPYDPDITWKRRSQKWGKSVDEVRQLYENRTPVTRDDVARLAHVQGQAVENFAELVGIPFNQVPAMTECGNTRFNLRVPSQEATLPFVTTMAGILVAAELVKDQYAPNYQLYNWFEHNLLWSPKSNRHRFLPRTKNCSFCNNEEPPDGYVKV